MVRKRGESALADPTLTDDQVIAFLHRHPDFLVRHSEVLLALNLPARFDDASGVVDLLAFTIQRQRDEMARIKGAAETLIHTSRSNMTTQSRTHKAALLLLQSGSMEALVQTVADDLPALLDVDAVTLRVEESDQAIAELAVVGRLPAGFADRMLGGADRDCALSQEMPGDPVLFGEAAGLVKSSAVVRVAAAGRCPAGLLSLGSRHGRTFYSGQGTELLGFLARVLQSSLHRFVG